MIDSLNALSLLSMKVFASCSSKFKTNNFLNLIFCILHIVRGNSRSKCDTIGGSPDQSLENCILGDSQDTGCDGFIYEECVYHGHDAGFTPPPGEIVDATECSVNFFR